MKRIALIVNNDPLFVAEPISRFLKNLKYEIQFLVLLNTASTQNKNYIRTSAQIVGLKFILKEAGVFGFHVLKAFFFGIFIPNLWAKVSMKRAAKEKHIPVFDITDVNSEQLKNLLREYKIDIVLSTASQIYKEKILSLPGLKIFNFHPGLLPQNKGRFPIFWALLNRDAHQGMTCHEISQAIDAGDIVFQEIFDLSATALPLTVGKIIKIYQKNFPHYISRAIEIVNSNASYPGRITGLELKEFYGPTPTASDIKRLG